MARGLLNGQAQRGGPQSAAPQASAMPAGEEEPSNVSPEEQAQYDQFVSNGMQLLYSEETLPQFLQALQGNGAPTEGLANALATLVMRLEDSAGQNGAEISGDVKFHGATELLGQMVEVAKEAGIHEFSDEETEQALYLALDLYRTTRQEQGKLPEEEIEQDMQMLVQAEQQGNLEEVLPGITEYAANAPQPEAAAPPPRRGLMRK